METKYLTLDEIQQELLGILVPLVDFLDSHGLYYGLYAGTLLGAIRHQGFIPWDDDLDICMPRPAYERFLELADELPDPLFVITSKNSGISNQFAKVCTSKVRAQEPSYEGQTDEYLWVDVFPIDGVPEDDDERAAWLSKLTKLGTRRHWLSVNPKASKSFAKRVVKTLYRAFSLPGKAARLDAKLNMLFTKYPYEAHEYVCCYAGGLRKPLKYSKGLFEQYIEVPFDKYEFKAPGCWEEMLSGVYGNYMELPPESKRVTHESKVWRV